MSTAVISPFATVRTVFAALTCDPGPLGLDCARFDPRLRLPARPMTLPELRRWLDRHPDRRTARAAVWRELAARAVRGGDPGWRVAAAGMAMPALQRRARALSTSSGVDTEFTVLAGFLHSLDDGTAGNRDWLRP